MSKYVENYHFRIPELFMKAGLTNIRLNGYLPTFLLCDTRRTTKEMKAHLEARLGLWKKLENRNKKCAALGGMNEQEFQELNQKYTAYLQDLITHPRKIRNTPELHVYSRLIVHGTKSA